MANEIKNHESEFPAHRAAVIAASISIFILVFQPLGISAGSIFEAFIILGLAPLNFTVMVLVHRFPLGAGPVRAVLNALVFLIANILYLEIAAAPSSMWLKGIKVALLSILFVSAIAIWNRHRRLENEIIELKKQQAPPSQPMLTLRGENDREILRLAPASLLFAKASGNYVEIAYRSNGALERTLLRATLAGIGQQAGGALVPCHRSYWVNISAAQRLLMRNGRMEIEFPDNCSTPVSRRYQTAIRTAANA